MKVSPQKRENAPRYPKNSDIGGVCKTAAALTLTATTLFSVGGCDGISNKFKTGKFNKTDIVTIETDPIDIDGEIAIVGGLTEDIPYYLSIDSEGTIVELVRDYTKNEIEILLDNGDTLHLEETEYYIVSCNIYDIESDSDFYKYLEENDLSYSVIDDNTIYVFPLTGKNYIETIELAGDVVCEEEG